ncbi:MAG: hypothetical protein RLZZ200_2567 [Pseudomonadota bacterium]|jgi:signal transduction histidine kinase/ActR/RegA family two-component response regulator
MTESLARQAEHARKLLDADAVCFWHADVAGVSEPLACDPPEFLRHTFLMPPSPGTVRLVSGADAGPLLSPAARDDAASPGRGLSLLIGTAAHVGLQAIWLNGRQPPPNALQIGDFLAFRWVQLLADRPRQTAQASLRSMVLSLPLGAIVMPSGQDLGLVNAIAARWLGLDVGEHPVHILKEALSRLEDQTVNREESAGGVSGVLSQGGEGSLSVVWRFATEPAALQVTVAAIEGDAGWVWLLEDISAQQRIASNLANARDAAEAASRLKSNFLTTMSHELRTPLNSILGFTQILALSPSEPLTRRQAQAVDRIRKAGDHLLQLVNEVLDLSRIEAGFMELAISPHDIEAAIAECLHDIEAQAQDRNIRVNRPAASNLPPVLIDGMRFKQVMLNLLGNAVKYNVEGGQVDIRIDRIPDDKCRISVIDNGPGIPVERQPEVFKPFSRAGAENSGVEGTGIGLAIARRVIKALNGNIGFESLPVRTGCCFWIDLPFAVAPSRHGSQDYLPRERVSLPPGKRILYVEDNPANVELMQEILDTQAGIELIVANDAETGLNLAFGSPPDLVLMDINLPGMDGIEALACLRFHHATDTVPVIAVTAAAMSGDVERAREAGFEDYVTKPFNVMDLLGTMARALGNRRSAPQ